MRPETRVALNAYLENQAELNGADYADVRAGKSFAIEPSVQQKLIDRQGESSAFMSEINVVPVDEMKGEKLGLSVSSPIAGRTDTAAGDERDTVDPSGLDEEGYECVQTNSDTHLTYAKLDMWAKFPDFEIRIRNQILEQQRRDRIMIGFNGVQAARKTNKVNFPLLQDVNKGWLHHIRQYRDGLRVLSEGETEADKIIINKAGGGDYFNIDALVMDATHNLMPSWARGDSELVVILGDALQHDTYFPLVNQDLEPTEKIAADLILSAKRIGSRRPVAVPYFPSRSMLITRLDNLSLYEQSGKRRRTVVDKASRDRVQTFESSNDGYVIENYDFVCLIENVQFGPTPAPGPGGG